MDEKQEALVSIASKVIDDLGAEIEILNNRISILESTPEESFIPLEPKRKFEEDKSFVENEKLFIINQIKSTVTKKTGEKLGQEELVYKLSKEGQEEEERQFKMIRENQEMKVEIEKLKKQIEELESKNKDGEETSEE